MFLFVFSAIIFFAPEFGGYFLEYNNFIPADPLKTPAHIAPVWYFTPYYSMLRAITSEMMYALIACVLAGAVLGVLKAKVGALIKGAILVGALVIVALMLAMLVTPAATAYLLTRRLPTMMAVGVARPRASGQVMTTTVIANSSAVCTPAPTDHQTRKVTVPPISATSFVSPTN